MKVRRTLLSKTQMQRARNVVRALLIKKILLSHTQKIAFQSTAFWAIHPEAIMLLRKVAKRASNRLKQPCLPRQGKRRERPTWDEKSLRALRASKFRIVFVRASSEGLSSEKGKASTS
jgi:hypothetical protein